MSKNCFVAKRMSWQKRLVWSLLFFVYPVAALVMLVMLW